MDRIRITGVLLALAACAISLTTVHQSVTTLAQGAQVPIFEYDSSFPKPLPEKWAIGPIGGLAVDRQDHLFVVQRPGTLLNNERMSGADDTPPKADCCVPAPPVLEFDQNGTLVNSWGGPGAGYDWPQSEHGVFVDHKDVVWLAGNGAKDHQLLTFTRQGKFLRQFGKAGMSKGSADTTNMRGPANLVVDQASNEVYVADGYGNRRVIVLDADTFAFKRMWGAYGNRPDDADPGPYNPDAPPAQQFRNPVHCAERANDGMVYVCDRPNDRVQVFSSDGKFVSEHFIHKNTLADGSVWDIAFSKDPQQQFLYMADGANEHVRIFDRKSMTELTHFGYGGRQPGMFLGVHSIAVDSKGNIYTTETYTGKRLQKFVNKGLAAITKPTAAPTPWPAKTGD
jgi:DNA-binding beta-propeller fold protein YncE